MMAKVKHPFLKNFCHNSKYYKTEYLGMVISYIRVKYKIIRIIFLVKTEFKILVTFSLLQFPL